MTSSPSIDPSLVKLAKKVVAHGLVQAGADDFRPDMRRHRQDDVAYRPGLPYSALMPTVRLMRSMGYTGDVFSSAADFLAFPRLDTGHAIPTILVTAFPNDVDQARALVDGAACYLRKPVDEEHLTRCVREALKSALSPEEDS